MAPPCRSDRGPAALARRAGADRGGSRHPGGSGAPHRHAVPSPRRAARPASGAGLSPPRARHNAVEHAAAHCARHRPATGPCRLPLPPEEAHMTTEPHAKRRGRLKNGAPGGDPSTAPRCGSRTRSGMACRAPAMANGRCRMHGGASTGPRTQDGLRRLRAARTTHGFWRPESCEFRRYCAEFLANARLWLAIAKLRRRPRRQAGKNDAVQKLTFTPSSPP